ncbi:hypothetical protein [Thiobacillus sp. 65-1402]|uniref:DUF7931 domain-containing protein n=1 Tax=Thiobacillus sp. 65-1402 TaxID=1895861 RepID=UPI000929EB8D|nr:hypothetical protein [Thiobacillus sp. 65-1402]OJW41014.1 MAG: hypothetical protein BGO60_04735 [Thiobacillus sp. 65-1059]OJW90639.1 MAG: hypothetical protein BGO62_12840 [Thiobacillus sp. 65-1402]
MNALETPAELRAAFDALLAATQRRLRLYDHDLSLFDLDHAPRHAALRALCVAGGGRRIELLLDDIGRVAGDHPRLMQLLRDFGHILEIRQADPDAPRPGQAFVLADRHGVLLRADKAAVHGVLHPDDPGSAVALHQDFEGMWQRAPAAVSATTLGL